MNQTIENPFTPAGADSQISAHISGRGLFTGDKLMNPKTARLQEIAEELRQMFPGMTRVDICAEAYNESKSCKISVMGHKTYASAVETMRELGVGTRKKNPQIGEGWIGDYTRLTGTGDDGVEVTTYPDELPPTCRIEEVTERIPKRQTVDTGDFVEIKQRKVVCSLAHEKVAA